MNHLTEYSVDGGYTWATLVASETAGSGLSHTITGLPPGVYNGALLRITPLSGVNLIPAVSDPFNFTIVAGNTGVSLAQLGSMLVGADGKVSLSGAGNVSFSPVQSISAGSIFVTGAGTVGLSPASMTGSGGIVAQGQGAFSLAGASTVSAGTVTDLPVLLGGTVAQFANVTSSGTGAVALSGSFNKSLVGGSVAAIGTIGIGGDFSTPLSAALASSTGNLTVTGTVDKGLVDIALSSTGEVPLSDTTAPSITAFTLGTVSGLTVPVSVFTATDVGGTVTGYIITESATAPAHDAAGWQSSASYWTTNGYTASGARTSYLYAYAKDSASPPLVSAAYQSAAQVVFTVSSSLVETDSFDAPVGVTAYTNGVTYQPGDVVSYTNLLFVALQTVSTTAPTTLAPKWAKYKTAGWLETIDNTFSIHPSGYLTTTGGLGQNIYREGYSDNHYASGNMGIGNSLILVRCNGANHYRVINTVGWDDETETSYRIANIARFYAGLQTNLMGINLPSLTSTSYTKLSVEGTSPVTLKLYTKDSIGGAWSLVLTTTDSHANKILTGSPGATGTIDDWESGDL